jgi:hypothetical protein
MSNVLRGSSCISSRRRRSRGRDLRNSRVRSYIKDMLGEGRMDWAALRSDQSDRRLIGWSRSQKPVRALRIKERLLLLALRSVVDELLLEILRDICPSGTPRVRRGQRPSIRDTVAIAVFLLTLLFLTALFFIHALPLFIDLAALFIYLTLAFCFLLILLSASILVLLLLTVIIHPTPVTNPEVVRVTVVEVIPTTVIVVVVPTPAKIYAPVAISFIVVVPATATASPTTVIVVIIIIVVIVVVVVVVPTATPMKLTGDIVPLVIGKPTWGEVLPER